MKKLDGVGPVDNRPFQFAVCDSFGKTFLMLLVCNLGATGGLRVNSSPVKVKLIIFPLLLTERNAILPMKDKAPCEVFGQSLMKSCECYAPLHCRYIETCRSAMLKFFVSNYRFFFFLTRLLLKATCNQKRCIPIKTVHN